MEMNTCMTLTLVVIQALLCGWIVNVDSAQCVQEGVCTCTFENGSKIDLSLLGNQHGSPLISNVPGPNDEYYSYSFNPCYPFTEGNMWYCKNVSACQGTTDGIFMNVGDVNSVKLEYVGGRLVGTYSNTDSIKVTRTSTVDFVCDPNAEEPTSIVYGEVTKTFYRFSVTSMHACVSGQPSPIPSPTPRIGCHTNYGDFINRCEHAYDGQEQPIKVLIIQNWDGSCKFPANKDVALVLHSESSTCVGVRNRCNPSHAFSVNGEVCREVQ